MSNVAPMPEAAPPKARAAAAVDLLLVLLAAGSLALTAWSLSTLLHDRAGAPWPIAGLGVAVFDLPAVSASFLVYHRRKAPHTALGARIVMTLALLGSAVVNGAHGAMMGGWTVAAILAAAPLSLEVVFELRHRTLTLAIWFLFRRQAYDALRRDAWERIAPAVSDETPAGPQASGTTVPVARPARSARAVLAERFAQMDPADAVLIAAQSHPRLNATELAELLADYGVTVDALTVALVLGHVPQRVTVERAPHGPQPPAEALPEPEAQPALTGGATPAKAPQESVSSSRMSFGFATTVHDVTPPAPPLVATTVHDEPQDPRAAALMARNAERSAARAAAIATIRAEALTVEDVVARYGVTGQTARRWTREAQQ